MTGAERNLRLFQARRTLLSLPALPASSQFILEPDLVDQVLLRAKSLDRAS
jgi:hypothetical protein